ncbi:PREDICTED: 2-oxo-4-hydroxy-4-carboxy-5-ureidoimidazoline decarboxylase-like [Eufriesea mexicana]|uniref:2-oxo-4-hydroxy-4-carboxy-5-ureidoimidazoline decarboxylase-like n=1 Tax=Eufriesea mexicana TaxID=516756 RepID=UPI00083C2AB8|nr:PREDICTED: 2-oxo-4-hydroxy-4-carboxy-5-ureidoimidazoline decarboxylase-like [Eufriesea mexicana]
MYSGGILSMSEVNALTPEQFEWLFGNVVEHYSDIAQYVARMRPFTSVKSMKKCFYECLDKLDISEMENVLLRYPDLVGKLIGEGFLTSELQSEQENFLLESMSKGETQILRTCNDLYKEKFRIPFVIHVQKNKVPTILTSIHSRLQNTKDIELHVAIQEVKKICNSRIDHLVWSDIHI